MTKPKHAGTSTNTIATTGIDLWKRLRTHAGLNPRSWDKDLTALLKTNLSIHPDEKVAAALQRRNTTADELLRAILLVAGPYVAMWDELLTMLIEAGAIGSNSSIPIDFKFSNSDDDITLDLSQFRRQALARRLTIDKYSLAHMTDPRCLWELKEAVSGPGTGWGAIEDWIDDYWGSPILPEQLPELDATGTATGDLAAELLDLANYLLSELRSVAATRHEMNEFAVTRENSTNDHVRHVATAENDMIIGYLTGAAHQLAHGGSTVAPEADVWALLDRFRNTDPNRRTACDVLIDFLDLPAWRYRHELFANWVTAQTASALSDQTRVIHLESDGHIRFRFSGTHFATFSLPNPRLHLYTELRSPLAKPRGKSRGNNIQPDITLLREPTTELENAPLVIECKQYRKAKNVEFADALDDYARGRPNATVVLVDCGPVNETSVKKHIDQMRASRCHVIGELTPDNTETLAEFRQQVRDAVITRHVTRTTTRPRKYAARQTVAPVAYGGWDNADRAANSMSAHELRVALTARNRDRTPLLGFRDGMYDTHDDAALVRAYLLTNDERISPTIAAFASHNSTRIGPTTRWVVAVARVIDAALRDAAPERWTVDHLTDTSPLLLGEFGRDRTGRDWTDIADTIQHAWLNVLDQRFTRDQYSLLDKSLRDNPQGSLPAAIDAAAAV